MKRQEIGRKATLPKNDLLDKKSGMRWEKIQKDHISLFPPLHKQKNSNKCFHLF
jgi:hypothetical protein